MKRAKRFVAALLISTFVLVGCAAQEEETASFYLDEISGIANDDDVTPYMYMVNPTYAENQVIVFRERMSMDRNSGQTEKVYELDGATVTDEEIVIEYEGQVKRFDRLSESVAENEDKIQYQYISMSESVE